MRIQETKCEGAFTVEIEPYQDHRGLFARVFCQREFNEHGLATHFVQSNTSFSPQAGTLRGLHYQLAPHEEAKLVRCTQGSAYDVIVDLRPESETFMQWVATLLTAKARNMIYVPSGFAHGYQTLENETEVFYQVTEFYEPDFERGVRWNDAAFGITWPRSEDVTLSARDEAWPDFRPAEMGDST